MFKKILIIAGKVIVAIFALIGFGLTAGYFLIFFNLTDTTGEIDQNNDFYARSAEELKNKDDKKLKPPASSDEELSGINQEIDRLEKIKGQKVKVLCRLDVLNKLYPANASAIDKAYSFSGDESLLERMTLALTIRAGTSGLEDKQADCQADDLISREREIKSFASSGDGNLFPWLTTAEWETIKQAISKDQEQIKRAAAAADIEPRLLLSALAVEQLRLYFTQREFFEKFFEPLKILANANKMAWGVMSIKEKTAIAIEYNLRNKASVFYPGEKYEALLDFPETDDIAAERYRRLTDEQDHYYSYLYGALYLKEISAQWEKAGFPAEDRPEIMATLFNVGFEHSQPKKDPQVGGSTMAINGIDYTFGALAYEIFYSGELSEIFPYSRADDF